MNVDRTGELTSAGEGGRPGSGEAQCEPPPGGPALSEAPLAEADAAALAAVLAALGDPVRLRLLSVLAACGEVCSCHLEAPLGKSQPTVSHHTRVLAEVGLIEADKRGRWTWWRIVPSRLAGIRQALGAWETAGQQAQPPAGAASAGAASAGAAWADAACSGASSSPQNVALSSRTV